MDVDGDADMDVDVDVDSISDDDYEQDEAPADGYRLRPVARKRRRDADRAGGHNLRHVRRQAQYAHESSDEDDIDGLVDDFLSDEEVSFTTSLTSSSRICCTVRRQHATQVYQSPVCCHLVWKFALMRSCWLNPSRHAAFQALASCQRVFVAISFHIVCAAPQLALLL